MYACSGSDTTDLSSLFVICAWCNYTRRSSTFAPHLSSTLLVNHQVTAEGVGVVSSAAFGIVCFVPTVGTVSYLVSRLSNQ
jgi:hypothetical protein